MCCGRTFRNTVKSDIAKRITLTSHHFFLSLSVDVSWGESISGARCTLVEDDPRMCSLIAYFVLEWAFIEWRVSTLL